MRKSITGFYIPSGINVYHLRHIKDCGLERIVINVEQLTMAIGTGIAIISSIVIKDVCIAYQLQF